MQANESCRSMIPNDVLLQVVTFVDSSDWFKMIQMSSSSYNLCKSSTNYIFNAWKSSRGFSLPASLHSVAAAKELFKLFIIISDHSLQPTSCDVDDKHRTLLDLCVELRLYEFSKWLVGQGYKSSIDSETMFDCIRRHDIRGASILLSCGIPINRFRSRDDGLDVLSSAVMHGSVELVTFFLSHGVSIPSKILVDAIHTRGSDPNVVSIVEALIFLGKCDVNVSSIGGVPVVQVAILSSSYSLQLLELLLSNGADINARDLSEGGGLTALDIADRKRRKNCCMFLESHGGEHSVRYAVETGNVGLIEELIIRKKEMATYLPFLVCLASAMGQYTSLKTIIQSNKIPTPINAIHHRLGMTPLHLAACRGHKTICRLLLNAGMLPSAKVHGGIDLHIQAAVLSGSPIWYNPADEGPNGTILPPPVRLKTAAELARESGYPELGKMIDLLVIESEMVRRESEDYSSGQ